MNCLLKDRSGIYGMYLGIAAGIRYYQHPRIRIFHLDILKQAVLWPQCLPIYLVPIMKYHCTHTITSVWHPAHMPHSMKWWMTSECQEYTPEFTIPIPVLKEPGKAKK